MISPDEAVTIAGDRIGHAVSADPAIAAPKRFLWLSGLRSPKVAVGAAIVLVFVLVAAFGPMLDTVDPSAVGPDVLSPPSAAHWLGTTQSGQDCLAQLIDGTSTSLIVGFVSGLIATALSVIVGLIGGYLAGLADELLSVLSNVFLVIPTLPLVVVLAGYLPSKGWFSVALVISLTSWAWGARVLRVQAMSLRKRDFVSAARASGESTAHVIFREIMPNMTALIVSSFLFTVIFAVLTQAGLAFLGLSDVSTWSWGTILYWAENEGAMQVGAWWWFVPAGLCIALFGTALALMNFGIDEFVNPRLRVARVGTRRTTHPVE
jgi:peptide/nickel transport system permease protein